MMLHLMQRTRISCPMSWARLSVWTTRRVRLLGSSMASPIGSYSSERSIRPFTFMFPFCSLSVGSVCRSRQCRGDHQIRRRQGVALVRCSDTRRGHGRIHSGNVTDGKPASSQATHGLAIRTKSVRSPRPCNRLGWVTTSLPATPLAIV